jgi:hypothetical protein
MGKAAWVQLRPEPIVLKGKGEREGFWVTVRADRAGSVASGVSAGSQKESTSVNSDNLFVAERKDRSERLIDWNCEVLMSLLKEVRARQMVTEVRSITPNGVNVLLLESGVGSTPLDEVREIVTMPQFDASSSKKEIDHNDIELPEEVKTQLRSYIAVIASMYRPNSFHNFEVRP